MKGWTDRCSLALIPGSFFIQCTLGTPHTLQIFTGHYKVFAVSPVMGKPCNIYRLWGKFYNYHDVFLQTVNFTVFIHNIHMVSLCFLQLFFIDGTGFHYRDPIIPSPRSFHGVKICSVHCTPSLARPRQATLLPLKRGIHYQSLALIKCQINHFFLSHNRLACQPARVN